MNRRTEAALLAVGCVLASIAIARVSRAYGSLAASVPVAAQRNIRGGPLGRDSVSRLADLATARDPFRFDAPKPASVIPAQIPASAPAAVESPPSVFLKGIVGGPPWNAVLGGVPGMSGDVVVRAGDQMDGIAVSYVSRRAVGLRWRDTTLVLELQEQVP